MTKVLIINTVRFNLNGISAVIKNYYQAMNKDCFKIDFLAIDTPVSEYQSFFKQNKCTCHVLHRKKVIQYFVGIIKTCKREKYDLVHIHGNSATMAVDLTALMLGGVKSRIVHSHNTATSHPMTHKILWPLFSALCTTRLACGEEAGRWLYRNKPYVVLKNGIEVSKYQASQEMRIKHRKLLGIEDAGVLIGHVGNFVEQKNHVYLIDVFKELHKSNPGTKLLLIGDGRLMPAIQEKVECANLNDSVIFLGKTTEVENYLQAMDIFLLPSLHEGLPLVLVEAQAAGLSCVVSDAVSKEADLTGTCSFLRIEKDSIKDWVNEILRIGQKYEGCDREEVSKINQQKIRDKGYDITQSSNILEQIYIAASGE